MRYDMENTDETLTIFFNQKKKTLTILERERERGIERTLRFQIWGFGRENERAVGMCDAIYIQNYVL